MLTMSAHTYAVQSIVFLRYGVHVASHRVINTLARETDVSPLPQFFFLAFVTDGSLGLCPAATLISRRI